MNFDDLKKQVLISDFLSRLGHQPIRTGRVELSYRAPYRNDSAPSLQVNDRLGLWYDHGSGQGGTVLDLAMLLFNTTDVRQAAVQIRELFELPVSRTRPGSSFRIPEKRSERIPNYRLLKIGAIGTNRAINAYLEGRGILGEAIRSRAVKEIYYELEHESGQRKRYFGAGWFNDSDGVDVRSDFAKLCLFKKDMLTLPGTVGERVNIFEGMMDFLSALKERTVTLKDHNVILNSLSMTGRLVQRLEEVEPSAIRLFLDFGKAGNEQTQKLLQAFPGALDRRHYFDGFGDYNEKIKAGMLMPAPQFKR